MMKLGPVSERVSELRKKYRATIPTLDAERVRILTDYYRSSQNEIPVIRRAKAIYEILTKMTVRVEPNELLVSNLLVFIAFRPPSLISPLL